MVVTQNTKLTSDHAGNIVVVKNNITLDCDGYSIVGAGSGDGITVHKRSGVTVQNCDVTGFANGFWIVDTSGSRLLANTSHDNVDGFRLFQSKNNLLSRNLAVSNEVNGFVLAGTGTTGNRIEGNEASGSQTGFALTEDAANNRVHLNTASSNSVHGYLLDFRANNNLLDDNTAIDNYAGFTIANDASSNVLDSNAASQNTNGFALVDAQWNTLRWNEAVANGQFGIMLNASDSNTVRSNTANANGFVGIAAINGAGANRFDQNTALGNAGWDLGQDAASRATGNVWMDNTFATSINIP